MKAFIQTYGCQMNEHDSQRMASLLESIGYESTREPAEADLIVLNTCAVRHNPENKVYSFLGTLRPLKKSNPDLLVAVGGCVAQRAGEAILERNSDVDIVFGPDNTFELPEMIDAARGGERVVRTDWAGDGSKTRNFIPEQWVERGHVDGHKAYIAIMKGCNNFCSFCVVPYTRGREACREPENILREARAHIREGAREIWLLGQNVNSYNARGWAFRDLLEAVADLPLSRVRFTSPHPKDWTNALSDLMASRRTICNQLHLPFQSGSDRILKLMNRRHGIQDYLDKLDYARKVNPAIAFSTDVIVGFPTETEDDFRCTLEIIETGRFSQAFTFKYSPRPATRAARMDDDVPREVKDERLQRLIAVQKRIEQEELASYVGTRQDVLVDGPNPREPGVVNGRTDSYRPVSVEAGALRPAEGEVMRVDIVRCEGHWLRGVPAAEQRV